MNNDDLFKFNRLVDRSLLERNVAQRIDEREEFTQEFMEVPDRCVNSMLSKAVQDGRTLEVKMLLGRGADPNLEIDVHAKRLQDGSFLKNVVYPFGIDPYVNIGLNQLFHTMIRSRNFTIPILSLAMRCGNVLIVQALLDGGADPVGKGIRYEAISSGYKEIMEALFVDHVPSAREIYWAIEIGNLPIVTMLLDKVRVRVRLQVQGVTPIVNALLYVHPFAGSDASENTGVAALVMAVKRGFTGVVRELLARGIHPSPPNSDGNAKFNAQFMGALYAAVQADDPSITEMLLNGGADPNEEGVLELAVNRAADPRAYGKTSVLQALLLYGQDAACMARVGARVRARIVARVSVSVSVAAGGER